MEHIRIGSVLCNELENPRIVSWGLGLLLGLSGTALAGDEHAVLISACRDRIAGTDFSSSFIEVGVDHPIGMNCGFFEFEVPGGVLIDRQARVRLASVAHSPVIGTAKRVGNYEIRRDLHPGMGERLECALLVVTPSPGVDWEEFASAGLPYPTFRFAGSAPLPLPTIARKLTSTFEIRMDGRTLFSSTCVTGQRREEGEWVSNGGLPSSEGAGCASNQYLTLYFSNSNPLHEQALGRCNSVQKREGR